jgi:tetratricopeptide (TPR) repeat protein
MSDIFLSYASEDREKVQPIINQLADAGWSIWWDRSVEPGQPWADVIDRELERARCVVVVWSDNALRSPWVRLEANKARQKKNLIPVFLETVRVPAEFSNLQAIDLTTSADGLVQLESTVRSLIVRRRRPFRITAIAALLIAFAALSTSVCKFSTFCAIDRAPPEERSLAILPLNNLIADDQLNGIAEVFVDELRDTLAEVKDQPVASLSAMRAIPDDMSPVEIGRRLNVRWLITGNITASAGNLVFSLELVDTDTGYLVEGSRYELSMTNLDRGRIRMAEELLNLITGSAPELSSAQRLPSSGEAYVLYLTAKAIIREQHDTERLADAERLFNLALVLQPDYAEAQAGLCAVYLWRYERERRLEHFETGETHCKNSMKVGPGSADVALALGNLYHYQGNLALASEAFEQSLQRDPYSADALIGLADVAQADGNLTLAESQLRKAIGVQPGYWRSHNALGVFLLETGRAGEANPFFQIAIDLSPADAGALTNLGVAYALNQNFALSIKALQRALALEERASARANLGSVYFWMNDYENAAVQYEAAVHLSSEDFRLWANLGDARKEIPGADFRTPYVKSRALIDNELKVNPNNLEAWVGLAAAAAALGNLSESQEILQRYFSELSGNPNTAYVAAVAYARSDQLEKAIEMLESAVTGGFPALMIRVDPAFSDLHERQDFDRIVNGDS